MSESGRLAATQARTTAALIVCGVAWVGLIFTFTTLALLGEPLPPPPLGTALIGGLMTATLTAVFFRASQPSKTVEAAYMEGFELGIQSRMVARSSGPRLTRDS